MKDAIATDSAKAESSCSASSSDRRQCGFSFLVLLPLSLLASDSRESFHSWADSPEIWKKQEIQPTTRRKTNKLRQGHKWKRIELPDKVALAVKDSPASVGDKRDTARSPGGGNSDPLQCSCLENVMDRYNKDPKLNSVKFKNTICEMISFD